MGDIYDQHEALADEYSAGLMDPYNEGEAPAEGFDVADGFDVAVSPALGAETEREVPQDGKRPEAKRGRYSLPNPLNGKSKSWQRVTNFVKMTDDTYHLELWKQRNVAKGLTLLMDQGRVTAREILAKDVKRDREWLNELCTTAQDAAEAYKMADEGTALHKSTELADYAGGNIHRVPVHHRTKVRMYLDALAAHGLTVVDDMIERVTVSMRYECAGKFDRIYQLTDGSYVIGDLKTGDDLDLSLPSIAAQLNCYEDGINEHGIFDGRRYDDSIKVRTDFGIVVHLPSTRDEVNVLKVDLAEGRTINAANLQVRATRRIKARHVAQVFQADLAGSSLADVEAYWLEQLNAAHTPNELVAVSVRARGFGQWNERLAGQARIIVAQLRSAEARMGS